MFSRSSFLAVAFLTLFSASIKASPVQAFDQVPILPPGTALSTPLALKAASAALAACEKQGYPVTTTVISPEGNLIVVLRSTGAGIHTIENSYNKAYSAATLGNNHNVERTSQLLSVMRSRGAIPTGEWTMPAQPLAGITLFAGGVRIAAKGKLIGGLGTSGTPYGLIDQGCSVKGLEAIEAQLK